MNKNTATLQAAARELLSLGLHLRVLGKLCSKKIHGKRVSYNERQLFGANDVRIDGDRVQARTRRWSTEGSLADLVASLESGEPVAWKLSPTALPPQVNPVFSFAHDLWA